MFFFFSDCKVHKGASECWAYDRRDCANGGLCKPYLQNCSQLPGIDVAEHHLMCYATWTMSNTSGVLLEMKGCWMNDAAYVENHQHFLLVLHSKDFFFIGFIES